MAKKLLISLFLLAIVALGFVLVANYRSAHRTPESAATSFMNALGNGNADVTYGQFSVTFKKTMSQENWRKYVQSLQQTGQSPVLARKSLITDRFNVYPEGSNPQRFVYSMRVKNRDYQAVAVILKEDSAWKVDDFQGSYK